jgi:uncharacterized damage-inducible protein DinB
MSRGQRIGTHIERSVSGPMWHGSALGELLEGVRAEDAAQKPIRGAHSIWELVLHVTAWTEIARHRLTGSPMGNPMPDEDWPPVTDTSPDAWRATVERLKEAHRELAEDVAKLGDSDLVGLVRGKDHSVLAMVHGIVEHDAYHGGQIAILKKALGKG